MFSLVLFLKMKDRPGNIYLGGLLLTVAVNFGYNFLLVNQLASGILIALSACYGFLYGPLAYLYARVSLSEDPTYRNTRLLHFIPFVAVVMLALTGLSIMPAVAFVLMTSMAIYVVMGLLFIYKYERAARNLSASNRQKELRWMKFFFYAMALIILVNFLQKLWYPQVVIGTWTLNTEVLVQLTILLLVNVVTVQGLSNPAFFVKLTQEQLAVPQSTAREKLASTYSDSVLDQVLQRLDEQMNTVQPFNDPDLTVNKLAALLDVQPKALSQAINGKLGTNFAEYINSKRIASAEARFKAPKDPKETVMDVMYEVGFNSRSVFNTLFKKKTGLTPSAYKKQFQTPE